MTEPFDLSVIIDICEREGVGAIASRGPNAVVFAEGDAADTLYLLARGHVEINVAGHAVSFLRAPAIFGEMALFEEAPRSATVVTLADCTLVALNLDQFNALTARAPALTGFVVRTIAQRLRRTTRYYADMLEISVGFGDDAPPAERKGLGLSAQTRKAW